MNQKFNLSNFQINPEEILNFIQQNPHHPILLLLSHILNNLLLAERSISLQNSNNDSDKANGFYNRKIKSSIGELNINVPRLRYSHFDSQFLPPPYSRTYPQEYQSILLSLILNSYSPNAIKYILETLNLPYSPYQISELKDAIYESAKQINNLPIPDDLFVVYIDAYHGTDNGLIKDEETNKIRKAVIYIVIGITLSGNKLLLGAYPVFGNENKGTYLSIFNNLKERGLYKPLIFVIDDFSGLKEAIKEIFPLSDIQICLVHLKRNIRRNMSKEEAKRLISEIDKIRQENDFTIAVSRFEKIVSEYKEKYPTFVKYLLQRKENYFAHMKYPEEVRKFIYTTNIAENFNSMLEVLRINSGGYFASQKVVECGIYLIYNRLSNGRWRKGVPIIKSMEYELRQIFNLRFSNVQTQNC